MLALLSADALMKLGDTRQAHAWYGTARTASDDMGDVRLRALVRAQQAMLPYYYGDLAETVRLAREAQDAGRGAPSSPAALGAAAEARALARMGEHKAARAALAEAEQIFARMPTEGHDHLAFRFSERRLQFYRIGTLIELGEPRGRLDARPVRPLRHRPSAHPARPGDAPGRDGEVEDACRAGGEGAAAGAAGAPHLDRAQPGPGAAAAVPPARRRMAAGAPPDLLLAEAIPQLALERS